MNIALDAQAARFRASVIRQIRAFFEERDYIEVETPVRISAPAQEFAIDCPASGGAFLRASPELQMKRLLVAGFEKIFQIGPCFRSLECGKRHNPEFTMLEWYSAGGSYDTVLDETKKLLSHLCRALELERTLSFVEAPWNEITVGEAFVRYAGWNPVEQWDAERFDYDMVTKVEPNLPVDAPCILRDYPAPAASLARLSAKDERVAERWELYLNGLEIANAYSELCDAAVQRERFEREAKERAKAGKDVYPFDEDFFRALQRGMPECGGIAVGVDRLVMFLAGKQDIADVRLFCQRPGYMF